jgi:uncharacterized membrane protein YqaE (UPF0057 family)
MLYLVAVLLPPLAVLLAGKPFQAIINIFLTIAFYVPGLIHALLVVHNKYSDDRTAKLIDAQQKAAQQQIAAMQAMTNQQLAATKAQMDMQAAQAAAAQAAAAQAAQFAAMQAAQPAPAAQPTPATGIAATPAVVRTASPVAQPALDASSTSVPPVE